MWRYSILLCALLGVAGCVGEGGPSVFDDALKDFRGDNMRIRSDSSALNELSGQVPSLKPRDLP